MNLCECGCGQEAAQGRRFLPSHHLPRRKDGTCRNGHDLTVVGTHKSGYCRQCSKDVYYRNKPKDIEEYRRIARERAHKYHVNMTPERRVAWLELQRQANKKYGDRHRDKLKRYQEGYRQNRRPERIAAMKSRDLMRAYGITLQQYEEMAAKQAGKCAICQGPQSQQRRAGRLDIDHNHATGKVRELLCTPCNMMLGLSKEDISILLAAARYLAAHSDSLEILDVGVAKA